MEFGDALPGTSVPTNVSDRLEAFLNDDTSSVDSPTQNSERMEWREADEDISMGGDEMNGRSEEDEPDNDEGDDVIAEMGLTKAEISHIEEMKKENPSMFLSAWEDDDKDIIEKNMLDPKEQFLTAAEEGNLQLVVEMLQRSPELIMSVDSDGYTPLHRAAYNNHSTVVKLLLANGANPEARTANGWTVLHSAAVWSNYEVVGVLLSHGVDVNATSNGNLTALHLAVTSQENSENVFHTVRYLLQAPGIDVGITSKAGDTPLELARRSSKRLYTLINEFHEKI